MQCPDQEVAFLCDDLRLSGCLQRRLSIGGRMKRTLSILISGCVIAAFLASTTLGLLSVSRQATLDFRIGQLITQAFLYRGGAYIHLARTRDPLDDLGPFHVYSSSIGANVIDLSAVAPDRFLGIGWGVSPQYQQLQARIAMAETWMYGSLLGHLKQVVQVPGIREELVRVRHSLVRANSASIADLFVPWWLTQLCTTAAAGLWIRHVYRKRMQQKAGQCPGCGYDLRATPDRCPECGRVPSDRHDGTTI
jgi:hypothetical protein